MKNRITVLLAAAFAVTALLAVGAVAQGGTSAVQAGVIASHP